jgi:hypothetical protein
VALLALDAEVGFALCGASSVARERRGGPSPDQHGNSPSSPTDGPTRLVRSAVLRDRAEETQTVRGEAHKQLRPIGREGD